MKTLLLMRHAKSSWKFPDLPDHERPLNKRGRRDAPLMGKFLQDRDLVPQRIISSTAARARQTAEALAESANYRGDIVYLEKLYMAEVEEYINTLHDLPDDLDRVLVIGHNPGMETLLQVISHRIESLPTAVVAHIDVPIDQWNQFNGQTTGEIVEIWRPKDVRVEVEEEEREKAKAKGKAKDKGKSSKKDK